MLIDKIIEDLSFTYFSDNTLLQNNKDYKDADKLVSDAMMKLKKMLPEDQHKFYLELEKYINNREAVSEKEAYKYAFNQGAKLILELLSDK